VVGSVVLIPLQAREKNFDKQHIKLLCETERQKQLLENITQFAFASTFFGYKSNTMLNITTLRTL